MRSKCQATTQTPQVCLKTLFYNKFTVYWKPTPLFPLCDNFYMPPLKINTTFHRCKSGEVRVGLWPPTPLQCIPRYCFQENILGAVVTNFNPDEVAELNGGLFSLFIANNLSDDGREERTCRMKSAPFSLEWQTSASKFKGSAISKNPRLFYEAPIKVINTCKKHSFIGTVFHVHITKLAIY